MDSHMTASIKNIILFAFVLPISGCAWTSFGTRVASFENCEAYKQVSKNIEADLDTAKQLKVTGKITNNQLIQVDQEAGILSAEMKELCSFFISDRIDFEQYESGKANAYNRYAQYRKQIIEENQ